MGFPNPVLLAQGTTPIDGDIPVFDAAAEQWVPGSPVETITVPQPAIADAGAVDAQTSEEVTADDATSPANVAYTQADQTALADLANELKTQVNALVVDVAALVDELTDVRSKLNSALGELADAAIIST